MLAVLFTLTPGRQNDFMDCHQAKVPNPVLSIIAVKTHWNSTLELLEQANRLREFTGELLHNLEHTEYRLVFTTPDE
jgi:hypothetical protein